MLFSYRNDFYSIANRIIFIIFNFRTEKNQTKVQKRESIKGRDNLDKTSDQIIPWGFDSIGLDEKIRQKYCGKGITIAVLDTGIDYTHPDLTGQIIGGTSFINEDTGTYADYYDLNGHGTHVAGIIAAKDNDFGIVGVAPCTKLYAVKVLDRNGIGYASTIAAGIDWAIAHNVDIISMSLGGDIDSRIVEEMCYKAYMAGIVLVAAAGVDGDGSPDWDVDYPAQYSSVVSVAAYDNKLQHPFWSSEGPTNELSAPGVDILSTWTNGGYTKLSGTSMSTPYVTGMVALLMEKEHYDALETSARKDNKNQLSPDAIRGRFQVTAHDLGSPGKDDLFGFGSVHSDALFYDKPVENYFKVEFFGGGIDDEAIFESSVTHTTTIYITNITQADNSSRQAIVLVFDQNGTSHTTTYQPVVTLNANSTNSNEPEFNVSTWNMWLKEGTTPDNVAMNWTIYEQNSTDTSFMAIFSTNHYIFVATAYIDQFLPAGKSLNPSWGYYYDKRIQLEQGWTFNQRYAGSGWSGGNWKHAFTAGENYDYFTNTELAGDPYYGYYHKWLNDGSDGWDHCFEGSKYADHSHTYVVNGSLPNSATPPAYIEGNYIVSGLSFEDTADSTDSDGDGLSDGREYWYMTDKQVTDSDGDTISDSNEVNGTPRYVTGNASTSFNYYRSLDDVPDNTSYETRTFHTSGTLLDTDGDGGSDYWDLIPLDFDMDADGLVSNLTGAASNMTNYVATAVDTALGYIGYIATKAENAVANYVSETFNYQMTGTDWSIIGTVIGIAVTGIVIASDSFISKNATTGSYNVDTDTDGDGVPDSTDTDDDNDGMSDTYENSTQSLGSWQNRTRYNKRYAILVGGDESWDALWNDVEAMYNVLVEKYNWNASDIFVLYSDEARNTTKNGITISGPADALSDVCMNFSFNPYGLYNKVTNNDFLLYMQVTHGIKAPLEELAHPTDFFKMNQSGFHYNYLHTLLDGDLSCFRNVDRSVVVLANCFSQRGLDYLNPNRITITACGINELIRPWYYDGPFSFNDDHTEFCWNDKNDGFVKSFWNSDITQPISVKAAFDSATTACGDCDTWGSWLDTSHPTISSSIFAGKTYL